ncbi:hypothetical protein SeLEV6574_g06400 [Synchytrium endobioticum]|nr:hypothetical protein SeLEV6574_g06400 [Synchytrium endobioticum]
MKTLANPDTGPHGATSSRAASNVSSLDPDCNALETVTGSSVHGSDQATGQHHAVISPSKPSQTVGRMPSTPYHTTSCNGEANDDVNNAQPLLSSTTTSVSTGTRVNKRRKKRRTKRKATAAPSAAADGGRAEKHAADQFQSTAPSLPSKSSLTNQNKLRKESTTPPSTATSKSITPVSSSPTVMNPDIAEAILKYTRRKETEKALRTLIDIQRNQSHPFSKIANESPELFNQLIQMHIQTRTKGGDSNSSSSTENTNSSSSPNSQLGVTLKNSGEKDDSSMQPSIAPKAVETTITAPPPIPLKNLSIHDLSETIRRDSAMDLDPEADEKLTVAQVINAVQEISNDPTKQSKPEQPPSSVNVPRHDWYTSGPHVNIDIFVKKLHQDQINIGITSRTLEIVINLLQHVVVLFIILAHEILPETLTYRITPHKCEIKVEQRETERWTELGDVKSYLDPPMTNDGKPIIDRTIAESPGSVVINDVDNDSSLDDITEDDPRISHFFDSQYDRISSHIGLPRSRLSTPPEVVSGHESDHEGCRPRSSIHSMKTSHSDSQLNSHTRYEYHSSNASTPVPEYMDSPRYQSYKTLPPELYLEQLLERYSAGTLTPISSNAATPNRRAKVLPDMFDQPIGFGIYPPGAFETMDHEDSAFKCVAQSPTSYSDSAEAVSNKHTNVVESCFVIEGRSLNKDPDADSIVIHKALDDIRGWDSDDENLHSLTGSDKLAFTKDVLSECREDGPNSNFQDDELPALGRRSSLDLELYSVCDDSFDPDKTIEMDSRATVKLGYDHGNLPVWKGVKRPWDESSIVPTSPHYRPIGLLNMGNTCFVSNIVQCLATIPSFLKYFLKNGEGGYEVDLNPDNPLSISKGDVAVEFANLLRRLNEGQRPFFPREFRAVLQKYAGERFDDFQHHDSHEFLAFLLDCLHEDVNKVKKKPYIELLEFPETTPDVQIAEEFWDAHTKRNDSIVVNLFHGMYKSKVTCLDCGVASTKFDVHQELTLEIPEPPNHLDLLFINQEFVKLRYRLSLPPSAKTADVIESLSQQCKVSPQNIHAVVVEASRINRFVPKDYGVEDFDLSCENIVLYEWNTEKAAVALEHQPMKFSKTDRVIPFGCPMLLEFEPAVYKLREIYNLLIKEFRANGIVSSDLTDEDLESTTQVFYIQSEASRADSVESDDEEGDNIHCLYNQDEVIDLQAGDIKRIFLVWPKTMKLQFYNQDVDFKIERIFDSPPPSTVVTLDDCLKHFLEEEQGLEDWSCSKCKGSRGVKKLDLWSLPPVLVLHLKRFARHPRYLAWRKQDRMVDYDETIDLAPFIAEDAPLANSNVQYELFGVSNHIGTMGAGHYTAHCKRNSEWYSFDDEKVDQVENSERRKKWAYILFYRVRDPSRWL